MSERLERLNDRLHNLKPTICVEHARLVTEAYRKYKGLSPLMMRARVYEYYLDNCTVHIYDDELIVGNHTERPRSTPVFPEYGAKWILDEIDTFTTRTTDQLQLSPEDRAELIEILNEWESAEELTFDQKCDAAIDPLSVKAVRAGIISIGTRNCGTGLIFPQYDKLMKKGLAGYVEDYQQKLDECKIVNTEDLDKYDFYRACLISLKAVIRFAHRYADCAKEMAEKETDAVRKAELERIASNCRQVPEHGPRDFWEAVQFAWFIHLCINLEDNGHGICYGRYDQFMYPYYKMSVLDGDMDPDFAIELMACCWIKTTEIIKLRDQFDSVSFAGYPMWQNVTIGGQKRDGSDATNELSYAILDSWEAVKTVQPTLCFRYHDNTPEPFLRHAMKLTQKGYATPGYFNDKLIVPVVLSKGATMEEARDYVQACVECYPQDSDGRPVVGYVNMTKCLELALHNGVDPLTGIQFGPKTGDPKDFKSIDDVIQAHNAQVAHFIERMCTAYNIVGAMHAKYLPRTFSSTLVGGVLESGKSIEDGGATYNYSGGFLVALANAADSLVALQKLIFEEQAMTLPELIEILDNNFEGNERLRQILINKYPKYGNDNPEVDHYAHDIVTNYTNEIHKYRDNRGAPYEFAILSSSFNVLQGRTIGATPDGRLKGDPVADNASPMAGRDTTSPTATIKSLASLDQTRPTSGTLFNIKFDPNVVKGERGLEILEDCVKSYFDMYGHHIQLNLVNEKTLREAQKTPENFGNLMVRVAGYSAYFVELDRSIQENVIARTAHTNVGSCGCGC